LINIIEGRRSHRSFNDKKVTKGTIHILLDIVKYAPTNSNSQDTKIIVLRNENIIKNISNLTVDQYKRKSYEQKFGKHLSEKWAEYGDPLVKSRDKGFNPIFYKAPVVLIFHATKEKLMKKDNCVIASTIVSLAAREVGLETSYMGLFELVCNDINSWESISIHKELNIPETNQIYCALIMGYPKKKLDDIKRKPVDITWI
jgi:nitroreductase